MSASEVRSTDEMSRSTEIVSTRSCATAASAIGSSTDNVINLINRLFIAVGLDYLKKELITSGLALPSRYISTIGEPPLYSM